MTELTATAPLGDAPATASLSSASPRPPRNGRQGAPIPGATSIAAALLSAYRGRAPGLVSVPLPAAALATLGEAPLALRARATVTWERPSRGLALYGLGEAARPGGPRHEALSAATGTLRALAASAVAASVHPSARPRFFGGSRFTPGGAPHDPAWDAFGGWQFVVPAILVAADGQDLHGSYTAAVAPGDTIESLAARVECDLARALAKPSAPGPDAPRAAGGLAAGAWLEAVAGAVGEIARGDYLKVVLARQVTAPAPADTAAILCRLAAQYPACFVFSYRAGLATWLGASPELLVSLNEGRVEAACLAGSRPRGRDPEADRLLAHELVTSEKECAEHGFVVSALREGLEPFCRDLEIPPAPGLMRMPNIQHLHTPISGRTRNGADLLDLAARLHPTPAVGGWPREAALASLPGLERMDRGWYAAPIGWMDFEGDGEFAVALRSALVLGGSATLFAGCGIVAGSVPAEELAETELKLRPLREALKGAG